MKSRMKSISYKNPSRAESRGSGFVKLISGPVLDMDIHRIKLRSGTFSHGDAGKAIGYGVLKSGLRSSDSERTRIIS